MIPDPSGLIGGRARYAVLAEALIADIRSGRYPVGAILPSEHELAAEFAASRHTVREALRRLADLGLLRRQPGVGTRVVADRVASRYVQSGQELKDLFHYVRDVRMKVLECRDHRTRTDEAELLECEAGRPWLHVRAERFTGADVRPIALTDIFIARAYRGIEVDLVTPDRPIYKLIEDRYGVVAVAVRQTLAAVALEPDTARRLGVAAGSPGLSIVRKYVASSGEPFEIAVNLHPGDRFSYAMMLRMETAAAPR